MSTSRPVSSAAGPRRRDSSPRLLVRGSTRAGPGRTSSRITTRAVRDHPLRAGLRSTSSGSTTARRPGPRITQNPFVRRERSDRSLSSGPRVPAKKSGGREGGPGIPVTVRESRPEGPVTTIGCNAGSRFPDRCRSGESALPLPGGPAVFRPPKLTVTRRRKIRLDRSGQHSPRPARPATVVSRLETSRRFVSRARDVPRRRGVSSIGAVSTGSEGYPAPDGSGLGGTRLESNGRR